MIAWISKSGRLLALAVILLLAGCCVTVPSRARTESRTVELGEAESVRVRIEMGAGQLAVGGGADALLDAEFTYNLARWQPEVDYDVTGGRGELVIRQPRGVVRRFSVGELRYTWELGFSDSVPIDLGVALGAGESMLDVASLSLTSLDVEMGAGECVVDLAGNWEEDLEVSVRGGVGELTVRLPQQVGARVRVNGGLGEVNASGLRIEGDTYVNDAYENSATTLEVRIEGGIGRVNLDVSE